MRRVVALAVLTLAASVVLAGCGSSAPAAAQTIAVTGAGTVVAVPDRLAFSFGVDSRAPTARAALRADAAAAARLVAALRGAGVARRDLQTQDLSLSPQVRKGRVAGYLASTTVSATIRDFDRGGAVVDAATSAGATTVSGPTLVVSQTKALYRRALRRAVADAKAKASAVARAAGREVGAVASVEEQSQPPEPAEATAARAAAPPIEPGTQAIEASVTVAFELR